MFAIALLVNLAGVYLVLSAFQVQRVDLRSRLGYVQEERPPLAERLFGYLAQQWGRRGDRAGLEHRLRLAGFWGDPSRPYPSVEAFRAQQLMAAALTALIGWGGGLLIAFVAEKPAAMALPFGLLLAPLGLLMPQAEVEKAIRNRDDGLVVDQATALERLANFVAAGQPLPQAILVFSERPGGAFVVFLRQVAAEYVQSGDLAGAVERVMEANGNPGVLVPFATLARISQRLGGGISEDLRRLAGEMREETKRRITERGYRNTILMVVPAGLAILASMLVLAAPGFARMVQTFAGSGGF